MLQIFSLTAYNFNVHLKTAPVRRHEWAKRPSFTVAGREEDAAGATLRSMAYHLVA